MIGNDIVDLAQAKIESNWERKGYLDKIFTPSEQLYINSQENKTTAVWALWTRKEAAYKISNRQSHLRRYNPLCFECVDIVFCNGNILGKVFYENQIYFTKTQITNQYVYTIAVKNETDFKNVVSLKDTKDIKKIDGIPYYFDSKFSKNLPISKTHHGNFEKIVSILNPILT